MNNYNCSDTDENIEVIISYDQYMGQDTWRENFESDKSKYSAFFTAQEWKKEDFIITVADHAENRQIALKYGCLNEDYYSDYETLDVVKDAFDCSNYYELMQEYDHMGIDYSINFHTVHARGYSQGDYYHVYVLNAVYEEGLKSLINNYFWDLPILARVMVNDEEFNFDADGCYNWDRDAAIIEVNNWDISDIAKSEIIKLLPNEPAYD